ncbi:MAG TPA: discoidin domain-containing protein [Bryobacteraceae bacterium]|nr:discoidin domain-containing protein [Bryobacteraceae bacterium]
MHPKLAVTGILAVCLPLITNAQPVHSLYVSTAGSDSNPGVLSAPFRTVQHAIDAATPGSTVIVLEGRYTGPGNVNLDFRGKAITVQSRAPQNAACVHATILEAEGQGVIARFMHDEGPGTVFAGFTIVPGDRAGVAGGVAGFMEQSRNARPTTRNLRVERRGLLSTASGVVAQTVGMANGSPVGGRAWDGNNPFFQPAATTNYWGSGDVDGDGVVTAADAALAQQMVDGTRAPLPTADVDGSGVVDGADVALINGAVGGAALPGWWNKLTTREQRNDWLDKVMAREPTKHYPLFSWWFVCVQYSIQAHLHGAFYRNDLFGTPFGGGPTWFNIPMYSVSLSYGHAINAVLVGDDPLNIADWRFFDPESDHETWPTEWNMSGLPVDIFVPDLIQVGGMSYMGHQAAVSFLMGDNGIPASVTHSPNLVLSRPAQPPAVVPDNRPDLWNPRVLPVGDGMLLFGRQRADMALADDIHLTDLPYVDPPAGTPLVLDDQYARLLDFAKGPDGAIHLLWAGGAGYVPGLFHGILDTGTKTLSNVSRITTGMREIHGGRIIVTQGGDIHVFWSARSSTPDVAGVYWSTWNGSSWNPEQRVGPSGYFSDVAGSWQDDDASRYFFDVVTEQTGGIMLAWAAFDDSMNVTLRYSRYNGAWSAPSDIEATGIAGGVALARDSEGTVHLAYWRDGLHANYTSCGNLLHRTYAGTAWSDPDTVDSSGYGSASSPRMVATSSAVYLVWQRNAGMQRIPVWRRWVNSAWGIDHLLAVPAGADAYYPSMELLADGRLAIAWSSRSADRASIEMAYLQELNLAIAVSHAGTFTQGDSGDTYSITVTNAGATATTGTITVTDTLPAGLSATAISGSGWSCSLSPLSCTRSDSLAPSAAYPTITVTVDVAADAPGSVTNTVRCDEAIAGNSSASDVTHIVAKPSPVTVTLAPAAAVLYASQAQQFTPTVNNTANTAVTWSLSPAGVGSISASGLYTAPSSITSQKLVTVTATSQADASKQTSSTVTLYPPVTVSVAPASVSLGPSQTQQFSAAVTNAASTAVAWSIHPQVGTISAAGLYTAPSSISAMQTVTVTGTSVADNSKTASAILTLLSDLAAGKTATQSSAGYAPAGYAADGNTDGKFNDHSVSHTGYDANAWWQVDLGAPASINAVTIWNRTDGSQSRLSDYWVFISNTPFGPADTPATLSKRAATWSSHQTTVPNPALTINAGVQGRYVRVQLSGTNYLHMAEVQVTGTWPNLAAGKTATQSSAGYAPASYAADGNTDGNFNNHSVSHTGCDPHAWWQVDLGASAAINAVTIWNRTDGSQARLNDYWVFISNTPFGLADTPATLSKRAGTWSSHQTTVPNPYVSISAGVQGRYVRVQLSGTNYLHMAEVQVTGAWLNLAAGKTATQSSAGYAPASYAVDSNTDGNFNDHSVSHTGYDANAWWQVDLGASASISAITIWNRTDGSQQRLNDYWVFVSSTPFGAADTPATLSKRAATWSSHQTTVPSPSATINAGVQGRYVRVQLSGTNYLHMAEVQVMGAVP